MEISPLNLNPAVTVRMDKVVKSADSDGNEQLSKESKSETVSSHESPKSNNTNTMIEQSAHSKMQTLG